LIRFGSLVGGHRLVSRSSHPCATTVS
jgi:hypothetical protein